MYFNLFLEVNCVTIGFIFTVLPIHYVARLQFSDVLYFDIPVKRGRVRQLCLRLVMDNWVLYIFVNSRGSISNWAVRT